MQDNPMLKGMKKFTNQTIGIHLEVNCMSFHIIMTELYGASQLNAMGEGLVVVDVV